MTRLWGRILGGQRLYAPAPAGHWSTTTMIAALRLSGPTAPMVINGPVDTEVFRAYVDQVLTPVLDVGDVVVLDNLSSHKAPDIRERVERVGAHLWYLPPYSPDFNPIEQMWSKVKTALCKAAAQTEHALYLAIAEALETITPTDARGWFHHCNYEYS